MKRKFTGSCVALGTELGKVLMSSKESKEIIKAVIGLKKGEEVTIKLSEDTKRTIQNLK